MLAKKIQEYKSRLEPSKFNLLMDIFNDDVIVHAGVRSNSEEELCNVLGQAYMVVGRV